MPSFVFFLVIVCQSGEMCVNLDDTGAVNGSLPGVSFHSPVTSLFGKPCSRQAVIKVSKYMYYTFILCIFVTSYQLYTNIAYCYNKFQQIEVPCVNKVYYLCMLKVTLFQTLCYCHILTLAMLEPKVTSLCLQVNSRISLHVRAL